LGRPDAKPEVTQGNLVDPHIGVSLRKAFKRRVLRERLLETSLKLEHGG
jgi:hypothetical protein